MSLSGKSLFGLKTSFIFSFILVLVIPILASILLYASAYDKLKAEITRNNQGNLQLFSQTFDERIKTAIDLMQTASSNSSIKELALQDQLGLPLKQHTVLQAWRDLQLLRRDYISDIFIYFRNSQKIVSSYNSVLPPQLYYDSYLPLAGDFNSWLANIDASSSLEIKAYQTGPASSTVALSLEIAQASYKMQNVVIVCVFNESSLTRLMQNFALSDDLSPGALLINNPESGIIKTSTNSFEAAALFEPPALVFAQVSNFSDVKLQGKDYFLFNNPSTLGSIYYMALVPAAFVTEELKSFRLASFLYVGLSFIFGGLFALLLFNKNYQPIQHLIKKIFALDGPQAQATLSSRDNELTDISQIIDNTARQLDGSRSKATKLHLHELLNGTRLLDQDLNELYTNDQPGFNFDAFIVIMIRIDNWDKNVIDNIHAGKTERIIETIIDNVMTELSSSTSSFGCTVSISRNLFACISNTHLLDAEEKAWQISQQAKTFFDQTAGLVTVFAISDVATGPQAINLAYLQARQALDFSLVFGHSQILRYKLLPQNSFAYNHAYKEKARLIILSCLRSSGSCHSASLALLTEYSGEQAIIPDTVRGFISETNALLAEVARDQEARLKISILDDLDSILSKLATILESMQTSYVSETRSSRICAEIQQLISERYSDAALDVNAIANHFDLSPAHCSKLFKTECGLSISAALLASRMQAAEKLLLDSSLSVSEVAEQVGFSSSSVFIRVFKKEFGLTPGNYQKLALEGKISSLPDNLLP